MTRGTRLAPHVRRSVSTPRECRADTAADHSERSIEEEYVTRRRRSTVLSVAVAVAVASLCLAFPASAAFPGSNGDIAFLRRGSIRIVSPDGTIGARIGPGYDPAWS